MREDDEVHIEVTFRLAASHIGEDGRRFATHGRETPPALIQGPGEPVPWEMQGLLEPAD